MVGMFLVTLLWTLCSSMPLEEPPLPASGTIASSDSTVDSDDTDVNLAVQEPPNPTNGTIVSDDSTVDIIASHFTDVILPVEEPPLSTNGTIVTDDSTVDIIASDDTDVILPVEEPPISTNGTIVTDDSTVDIIASDDTDINLPVEEPPNPTNGTIVSDDSTVDIIASHDTDVILPVEEPPLSTNGTIVTDDSTVDIIASDDTDVILPVKEPPISTNGTIVTDDSTVDIIASDDTDVILPIVSTNGTIVTDDSTVDIIASDDTDFNLPVEEPPLSTNGTIVTDDSTVDNVEEPSNPTNGTIVTDDSTVDIIASHDTDVILPVEDPPFSTNGTIVSDDSTVDIIASDDTDISLDLDGVHYHIVGSNAREGRVHKHVDEDVIENSNDDDQAGNEINQDEKRDGRHFSENTFNHGSIYVSGSVKANRITIGSHVNIGGNFDHHDKDESEHDDKHDHDKHNDHYDKHDHDKHDDHYDKHDDNDHHQLPLTPGLGLNAEDKHDDNDHHPLPLTPGLGLNAEDEKDLKAAFEYIDLNKDEFLSGDELYEACSKLDIPITANETIKMVIFSKDEDDKLGVNYVKLGHLLKFAPSFNMRDLIHFWVHAAGFHHGHDLLDDDFELDEDYKYINHLYYVFLILDQDHDGQLTPTDLMMAFQDMGDKLERSRAEMMMAKDMAGVSYGFSFEQWREFIYEYNVGFHAKDRAEEWRKLFRFYLQEGEMTGYHRRHVDSGVRWAIGNPHIVQALNKIHAITKCEHMEVKAVEDAWIEVVEGLNYKLKIKIKTKSEKSYCHEEIVKVCDNVVVFKPLPNVCKGVDCLRLQDTEHIECQEEGELNYDAVREDLVHLLTDSQDWWPADYGNYGPLFVRLAWHSAGSYRSSDGRGGSDGGRLRFEPERSWADNTNLDKARRLLEPIKQKYGDHLSWGDLIVLAGNTAIEAMGGPILGFCGGRIDDQDGAESNLLGPSVEQEEFIPCPVNGECSAPLGPSTIGLIYVNPEGPMGDPNPKKSALQIREVFERMNMNDSETVALIGGGHAFGKAHGACPHGAGSEPKKDSENPWPGKCGTGKGEDTFTSGFELPFTTNPTQWDNEYFNNLLDYDWIVATGPGGKNQWHVDQEGGGPVAESVSGSHTQEIGLLTSDVAFTKDSPYKSLVEKWSTDMDSFNHAFSHAWYKLTTRDMGPATRCVGNDVPPPQPWQYPLPPPPQELPDFQLVKEEIKSILDSNSAGQLIRLSWQCTSTFRGTDYLGGCNGARIRHSPQKDWPVNVNLDKALELLETIKYFYFEKLSWADLIVLAGNAAVEHVGGNSMEFCGGRTDDVNGDASEFLSPKIIGNFHETLHDLRDYMDLMTLTPTEFAVINGAGYAVGARSNCAGLFCNRNSHVGKTAEDEPILSNVFFKRLLYKEWKEYTLPDSTPYMDGASGDDLLDFGRAGDDLIHVGPDFGKEEYSPRQMYKAVYEDLYMLKTDFLFKSDPELLAIAHKYAKNNQLFLDNFALTWTKLANIDRFDGPTGNLCN